MTIEIDVFWDTILVYEAISLLVQNSLLRSRSIFVVENGKGDTGEEEETRET